MIYIELGFRKIFSFIRLFLLKIRYWSRIRFSLNESISISTIIKIRNHGKIIFGKKISTRKNVELNSNQGGIIKVGDNSFFNNNCIVASHEKIDIGKDCSFGPNVVIYDHDHDFRISGGKKMEK